MKESLQEHLNVTLTETLTKTIECWLSEQIEQQRWPVRDYPYMGPDTCRLMAEVSVTVLAAIYDAEIELVREGWLDARGTFPPEQKG